jgi:hypothetical protein
MIPAALYGKIPSRLLDSEDLLTSNVFSFFRYSDRTYYLKALLQALDLEFTDDEAVNADFRFWPRYDDATEPDCVLVVGRYYILFEAKHLSGFGVESGNRKGQIEREIEGGMAEAHSLNREFVYVALTSHYHRPTSLLDHISIDGGRNILWLNWQRIARLLLESLESQADIPNRDFVRDLYQLLEKMRLRPFLPFTRLHLSSVHPTAVLFYSARSAKYRGAFIGFERALSDSRFQHALRGSLFYQHRYFVSLPKVNAPQSDFVLGRSSNASES